MKDDTRSAQKEKSENLSTAYIRAVHNKENPFVSMRRETVTDNSLSFAALGLLTFIFSNADTWKIIPKKIWKDRVEGRNTIYKLFQELKEKGYCVHLKHATRNQQGKFGSKQHNAYVFFEVKATKEDIEKEQAAFKLFFRNPANGDHGNGDTGKREVYKDQDVDKIKSKKKTTTPKGESLSLFDKNQPYMKILSDEEQEHFIKYVEAHKHEADNLKAWMNDCAKKKYWLTATRSPEQKAEAHKQLTHWIVQSFPGRKDIDHGYNYIEFINGMTSVHLKFGEKNFEKTCEEELAKRKLSLSLAMSA